MSITQPSTPRTTTPTPGQQAQTIVNTLLTNLGATALSNISVPLTNYWTSIKATPTEANVVAQSLILLPAILAQVPTAEAAGIQSIAQAGLDLIPVLQAALAAELASLVPVSTPAPAPTPA